jgi:hypothetical protein
LVLEESLALPGAAKLAIEMAPGKRV